LSRTIREKGIDFEITCTGDCRIEGYAGEIRQVLLNIIRNACEAVTRTGTKLRVQLTGIANRVEVSVIDQGIGIATELIPNIFNFGMTTKGEQGNGIGLWTVKRIVNKHRGEVNIHSTLGEGTRVDVWWPRTFVSSHDAVLA
jgi:signal transduction histidine kinase